MRQLHIIATVDPASGGPFEGLRLMAEAMSRAGHETEVITLDNPKAEFVKSFPFPVHACGPGGFKGGFTPRLVPWISHNSHRFDVALVHGLWNWASVGGWIGLRRTGLPYVLFTHGMMDPWFRKKYPIKHRLKQVAWFAAQGKALRDAKAVLFTCEEERRLAQGAFPGYDYSEKVVAFGIAEPPPASNAQILAFHALVPALGGRRYLLFLSRIHEKKGCDLLVEAFSRVASRYPDIDLVMAGPDQGGLGTRLAAMAERNGMAARIHWPGMIRGNAKWGAFYGSEAFILPSHQENFGIAVVEAMACGRPVLITDKINIWREIEASGAGLVGEDDIGGVLRLLEAWLAMSVFEKQAMSAAARMGYEQSFGIDTAARSLLSVLDDAVGQVDNHDIP